MAKGTDPSSGVTLAYHRFSLFHRMAHYLIMVSFFGLVFTGVPMKYEDSLWARTLLGLLGGESTLAVLHRLVAILAILAFFLEVGYLAWHVTVRRRPLASADSIVPGKKDLSDMVGMFRWFLGRGERPKFNRFTYWEKFDFWALLVGFLFIAWSGLMMWFPQAALRVFPGAALNFAFVVHSSGVFLATAAIYLLVHLFSAIGRPESFPGDEVIFSGYTPVDRYIRDRPLEYENRLKAGTLPEVVRPLPSPGKQRLFRVVTRVISVFAIIAAAYAALLVVWPLVF